MYEREKLATLLMTVPPFPSVVFARGSGKRHFVADHIADYLIANGVTFKEQEVQEPLTIEELRQMEGEPVWVQGPGHPEYGRWAIVEGVDTTDGDRILFLHADFTCHDYGSVWLAYRNKQEENG